MRSSYATCGSSSTEASTTSGWSRLSDSAISDSAFRSYLPPTFGTAAITALPFVSSKPSSRRITSSRNGGSVTAGPSAALGRSSSTTVMRENTAVISRNVTNTVKMSIIGTSSSSAGLRMCLLRIERSSAGLGEPEMADLGRCTGRKGVQELDGGRLEAVDELSGLGLQQSVHEQDRHRGHQAEGRAVHCLRDARRQEVRLFRRVHGRDRRERVDKTADGTEQPEQRREIRERGQVVSALLELRNRLHHALLHRLLDVVAAPHGALQSQPDGEQPRDGCIVLAGHLPRLVELAFQQGRLDPGPGAAIPGTQPRERDVALDRDGSTDRGHEQDGVHEGPALNEELHD